MLFDILPKMLIKQILGNETKEIKDLIFDSRKVKSGSLFFAIKGEQGDGHDYIDKAIELGASATILQELPENILPDHTYIQVEDSRKALAQVSNLFYDSPSSQLGLIGITGTNGKTTVCTLLYQLFEHMEIKCGLISTVRYAFGDHNEAATHTTPDPVSLNALLKKMVDAGCEYAFMEVSSHAIDQKRIEGITFCGGVFTNITHDHLDYHKTFKNYIHTKKKFFDVLDKKAFVVYNKDDRNGEVMVQNSAAQKLGYSLHELTEIKGKLISNSIAGLQMKINDQEVFSRMVGKYNAYNILAAYGTAVQLGVEIDKVLLGLSMLRGAEGRFELVVGTTKKIFGIVDYAHTPDALENILETLKELKTKNTQLITVVGCGGDRDKTKRPKMAYIASVLSDKVVLTSDNPRTEDPEAILDQMEEGVKENKDSIIRITNRKQAIKTALMLADNEDIVLIAGKGHEKYQDINGVKHPFDDKEELEKLLL